MFTKKKVDTLSNRFILDYLQLILIKYILFKETYYDLNASLEINLKKKKSGKLLLLYKENLGVYKSPPSVLNATSTARFGFTECSKHSTGHNLFSQSSLHLAKDLIH